MKKSVRNTLLSAIGLTLLITVVSSVFSYFAMSKDFDHVLGYFNSGSVSAVLAMYLPLAVPVIALVCCILIRKKASFHNAPAAGIPTVFSSVLTGLLMLASAYFVFSAEHALTKLEIGVMVFSVISAIYFILFPFFSDRSFMIFLSFSPAIWAALKLLEEYFREGSPINSPIRTINLTMLAFLLLFFAEEIRFGIGQQLTGSYYFCILSAIAFTGNAVFPKLAIIISDNADFEFNFIEWCLGAAIFLFLLARLASLPTALGEYIPAEKKGTKKKDPGESVNSIFDEIPNDHASETSNDIPGNDSSDETK